MKKSLGRALGDMSLEKFWDKEGEYCDTEGFEDTALDKTSANASANKGSKVDISEVCAICLNTIELEDLAIIKGCEHEYCVNCILQWATCKEAPWCPQCKKPFNYLYCHRLLDGTLSDMPVEESVCLMKRASWFVEYVKTMEKGKAISGSMAEEEIPAEWADPYQYYDDEEDEYDEDEQIEKYYFSSAAGRARVVLGNRRLGENGYMRAGRMYARPTTNGNTSQASGSASGGIGKPGKGRAAGGKLGPRGSGIDDAGEGPSSSQAGAGGSGAGPSIAASPCPPQVMKGQGRRAKRNARRAAADWEEL